MTFFKTLLLSLTLSLSAGLVYAGGTNNDIEKPPLTLKVYRADEQSFNVSSVLISGQKEVILIDAQFTRADAHRVVAEILSSGKKLTAIYISHGDPDYYFGLEVLKTAFPNVPIYASRPTIEWIEKTLANKLAFWGPKLLQNAPKHPVIPEPLPAAGLSIEGQAITVLGLNSAYPRRSYVWIPSIRAVVGGINVVSGKHLWMADAQTKKERQNWREVLESIQKLNPMIVIPAHAAPNAPQNLEAVVFTKNYLEQFERELANSKNSEELIQKMLKAYPELKRDSSLEIGAKVHTGELRW